jgi:hypothetical protein
MNYSTTFASRALASALTLLPIGITVGCGSKSQLAETRTPVSAAKPEPPPEPYGFKEFQTGMKLEDFKKIKSRLIYKDIQKYKHVYSISSSIANIKCEPMIRFEDFGDGLVISSLWIDLPKRSYSDVKVALVAKYGPPHKSSNITKSNAMGASFDGENAIWTNAISEIEAEELGSKIDECRISFAYKDIKQRLSTFDIEKDKKTKKDI